MEETDRRVGDFLAFLAERGKLDDATVILMADHGQGRGIGGHGHLDWGERPVPFVVWGQGAVPGAVSREPRSVCELALTVSELLGVDAPAAARGRSLVPAVGSRACATRRPGAALPGDRRRPRRGAAHRRGARPRCPATACGMDVDVLVVDDGSADLTARHRAARPGREVLSPRESRGLGRRAAHRPRARARRRLRRRRLPRRRRRVRRGRAAAVLDPVARGRADYVLGSRFLGAPREGMTWHRTWPTAPPPRCSATLMRHRAHRRPDRLPRLLAPRRS